LTLVPARDMDLEVLPAGSTTAVAAQPARATDTVVVTLAPGAYRVIGRSSGAAPETVDVILGSEPVRIRLSGGPPLMGALIVRAAESRGGEPRSGLDVLSTSGRLGGLGDRIALSPGTHTIRLCARRADGTVDVVDPFPVTIAAGRLTTIETVTTDRRTGASCGTG
jgi:hypothetical protein